MKLLRQENILSSLFDNYCDFRVQINGMDPISTLHEKFVQFIQCTDETLTLRMGTADDIRCHINTRA